MSVVEREKQTAMPAVLDPRVERGAALLDEKMPGWAERVNVGTIDIECPRKCVLGQVGGWLPMLKALDVDTMDAMEIDGHGFLDPDTEQDWRLAILSRRTS